MTQKIAFAASLLMVFAGLAQAQTTTCTCNSGATRTDNAAALAALLTNRMVCGNVGTEVWQEWHNGGASGAVVDYKLGPGVQPDPSTPVGTYRVNTENTVSYTYSGQSTSYTYDVCLVSSSNSYTFCGANYGGRNITGVRIGGSGLTPCSAVSNIAVLSVTDKRTPAKKPPVSAPATRAP
jgi:hypothetical protein